VSDHAHCGDSRSALGYVYQHKEDKDSEDGL
jgi:hypothetical protein